MSLPPDRTPVIVGVGEILDKPNDIANGLEPLALMEQALRHAETDAGSDLLNKIDSLGLINQVTWPYTAMPAQLAARINATPARAFYGPVGGETPIRALHEAAARIARGESHIAAICGAEAQNTLDRARKSGIPLPWTPKPEKFDPPLRGADFVHAAALNIGAFMPVTIYPFYENATHALRTVGTFALLAAAAGCSGDDNPYKPTPAWSGKKANIPAPPSLPTTPIKNGDGTYTIYGAIHQLRSQLHSKDVTANPITITGYIVDSNVGRAPECAIHKTGKADPDNCTPEVPSFWIADNKGNTKGLEGPHRGLGAQLRRHLRRHEGLQQAQAR